MKRVLFVFLMMVTAFPIQAQTGPAFLEFSAFSGGLLKPAGPRLTGLAVGVGKGRNQVSVEGGREFLSNYELGIGAELPASLSLPNLPGFTPAGPSSPNSTVESFGGNYRRDLLSESHGRMSMYGLAGTSYVRSKSKPATYTLPLANAFPNDAAFLQSAYQAPSTIPVPFLLRSHTLGISLGGGVRIPLLKGLGIRAEVRTRWTKGSDSTYINPAVPVRDGNGNPIVLPGGFAYRIASRSTPGPALKAETFFSATFGVYYRLFNTHV